ncbi:hypothetical protein SBY92_001213 [Candida maltosa Xu316]
MLRIFRVDHQRKLEDDNLRYEYIDIHLQNFIVWNYEGLLLGSSKNTVQIKIDESDLFKVFYGSCH